MSPRRPQRHSAHVCETPCGNLYRYILYRQGLHLKWNNRKLTENVPLKVIRWRFVSLPQIQQSASVFSARAARMSACSSVFLCVFVCVCVLRSVGLRPRGCTAVNGAQFSAANAPFAASALPCLLIWRTC